MLLMPIAYLFAGLLVFEKVFQRLNPDLIAKLLVPGLRPTAAAIARDLDSGGGRRGVIGGGLSAEWLLRSGLS